MQNNLKDWQALQETGYFDNHHCYPKENGKLVAEGEDDKIIARYVDLRPDMKAAVIGCGYGRETTRIAPQVDHVYGVDVSDFILNKAVAFLAEQGIGNFTPVLAERWRDDMPDGLDFAFCYIVFQHLTRDLTSDYVHGIAEKLTLEGEFVCQFAELSYGTDDATPGKMEEPCVRWSREDITELVEGAGLTLYRIDTQAIPEHGDWHWVHCGKAAKPARK